VFDVEQIEHLKNYFAPKVQTIESVRNFPNMAEVTDNTIIIKLENGQQNLYIAYKGEWRPVATLLGITGTKTWTDGSANTHTVKIVNGQITSWEIT
jgi:hypothetical protein